MNNNAKRTIKIIAITLFYSIFGFIVGLFLILPSNNFNIPGMNFFTLPYFPLGGVFVGMKLQKLSILIKSTQHI